jgi:small subunit ribosomal protein S6e
MTFKINISEKNGKTYHLETESEGLVDKELNQKVLGIEVSPDLNGYEFQITGASDKAGFTSVDGEGIGLRKVLLNYGKGMKRRSRREGKKKRPNFTPKGLRLRRTARGKVISPQISQINLKILKAGAKELAEIFPEQNQSKEVKAEVVA